MKPLALLPRRRPDHRSGRHRCLRVGPKQQVLESAARQPELMTIAEHQDKLLLAGLIDAASSSALVSRCGSLPPTRSLAQIANLRLK